MISSVYAGDLEEFAQWDETVKEIPTMALEDKAGWSVDNIYSLDKTDMKYGKVEIKNSFLWFLPTDTIEEITLTDNTDTCGSNCEFRQDLQIFTDTKLIDGKPKFLRLMDDGKWIESDIRSFQAYIVSKVIPYEVEDTQWVCI